MWVEIFIICISLHPMVKWKKLRDKSCNGMEETVLCLKLLKKNP